MKAVVRQGAAVCMESHITIHSTLVSAHTPLLLPIGAVSVVLIYWTLDQRVGGSGCLSGNRVSLKLCVI